MITPTYTLETSLLGNYYLIAGIDEVGRAPLAGPVVAAAIILNPDTVGRYRSRAKWWHDVRDSKTLSAAKREGLIDFIKENALDFAIGEASHLEIDEFNIHNASLLAMRRAVAKLGLSPQIVLVDGPHAIPGLGIRQQTVVEGDAKILSIAAASILAKVHRDSLLKKYSLQFPEFGFEKHKGYDTDLHRKALLEYGPCEIHRMSFTPVREIMNQRFTRLISSPLACDVASELVGED